MSRVASAARAEPLSAAQNAIVVGAMSLMEAIVVKYRQRWANVFGEAEMLAVGRAALVEAAQTYNPSRDIAFSTYATCRIQGALLDAISIEIRQRTPFLALALRAHSRANEYLAELPDSPAPDSGGPGQAWWRRSAEFSGGVATAVVAGIVADLLNTDVAGDGEEGVVRKQSYARVIAALQAARLELDDRERQVFDLHYGQDIALCDVAERMNVAYATAKRIHASLIERLGDKLRERGFVNLSDAGMAG